VSKAEKGKGGKSHDLPADRKLELEAERLRLVKVLGGKGASVSMLACVILLHYNEVLNLLPWQHPLFFFSTFVGGANTSCQHDSPSLALLAPQVRSWTS
jgi:hypothetical protein